jgi:hypothetical protein
MSYRVQLKKRLPFIPSVIDLNPGIRLFKSASRVVRLFSFNRSFTIRSMVVELTVRSDFRVSLPIGADPLLPP